MSSLKNKEKKYIIICSVIFICIVLGLIIQVGTISNAKSSLYQDADEQLEDVVNIIDASVDKAKERCQSELKSILSAPVTKQGEQEYLDEGNFNHLQNRLCGNSALSGGYIMDIIVKTPDCLKSIMGFDYSDVDFSNEKDNGEFWFCKSSSEDRAYLMISSRSLYRSELSYIFVIDFKEFYNRTVAYAVGDDCWCVLYDESSNLIIQTHSESGYLIITREEMKSRNVGYTKILECEDAQNSQNTGFVYSDNNYKNVRMYVKSSAQSVNKDFAVSVSMYQDAIDNRISQWFIAMFLATFLIAGSICGAIFIILYIGQREAALSHTVETLEEANELVNREKDEQEALFHHQRLETLGTLTAGIAHEFNNMLAPIMADSLLALEQVPEENTEVYDNLIDIYNCSRSAKELVSRITRLSRKTPEKAKTVLSPEAILENAISMVAPSVPKNTKIETKCLTERKITGNETQLCYMLMNLLLNAYQAMEPDGGLISITVYDSGEMVAFVIEDEGPGIPEDKLQSIFDPFYTTKAAGKGTGLGLSISYSTATDHGGNITAENRECGGARFTVLLRAAAKEA